MALGTEESGSQLPEARRVIAEGGGSAGPIAMEGSESGEGNTSAGTEAVVMVGESSVTGREGEGPSTHASVGAKAGNEKRPRHDLNDDNRPGWSPGERGSNWGRNASWRRRSRGGKRNWNGGMDTHRRSSYESNSMEAASDLLRSRLTTIHKGLRGIMAAQAALDACAINVTLNLKERDPIDEPEPAKKARYGSPNLPEEDEDDKS